MSRCVAILLVVCVSAGCSEKAKPEPLPRAGVALAAAVKKETPTPLPPVAAKLFERIGGEKGATEIANETIKILGDLPATKPLAAKINRVALIEFLVIASNGSQSKLGETLDLSTADWAELLPTLRTAMSNRNLSTDDREELLANIEKSR